MPGDLLVAYTVLGWRLAVVRTTARDGSADGVAYGAAAGSSGGGGGGGGVASSRLLLTVEYNNADVRGDDADGDGVVSPFEKAVYERIKRIDQDGDGKLSIHELYDVVEEAVAAKQARADATSEPRATSSQLPTHSHAHPRPCSSTSPPVPLAMLAPST
ncbi:MAG: hypothetical protein VX181_19790, partial [Pseudomonadota bacterium]|nr:hypothetical protein [Pseudomonadota bacterium]